jgi:hypothetical protein
MLAHKEKTIMDNCIVEIDGVKYIVPMMEIRATALLRGTKVSTEADAKVAPPPPTPPAPSAYVAQEPPVPPAPQVPQAPVAPPAPMHLLSPVTDAEWQAYLATAPSVAGSPVQHYESMVRPIIDGFLGFLHGKRVK